MDITLVFGALWVIFALLIVFLRDRLAALALLGLNVVIAVFLLVESDLIGAVVKAALGIIAALIIFFAATRMQAPQPRVGIRVLTPVVLLTLVLSYLVAFMLQSQFPAEHSLESYFIIVLFGIALATIASQASVLKLLLGILIFENVGTLVLAWAPNAAIFTVITEAFVVFIAFTIASIAAMDFAEYDTVDATQLTKLRG
ncbi:MAG: hypothetical protein ACXV4Z_07720 [Halobacteriota archaeon]